MRDLNDASRRLAYEVVLSDAAGERVLAAGVADTPSDVLVQVGVGDGRYAYPGGTRRIADRSRA